MQQWKPNVTVAAVIQKDKRFLIVEEKSNDHIVFNQPAGHLEENETILDAVKREVLEETAWDFKPEILIGIYLCPSPQANITYLRFCFAGSGIKHYPDRSLDESILRAVWMTKEELQANEQKMRSILVLRCIDDYLSGKSYSLDLLNHYPKIRS